MMSWVVAACFATVAVSAGAQTPAADWCEQVRAMTLEPGVAMAHWGVSVTALDGTVLCAVNAGQLFRPASNTKLFTTAAALALLGPAQTIETRVTGRLDAASGTVRGDLTLVGAGDANLDSGDLPYLSPAERPKGAAASAFAFHDLEALVAQLVAKGVKRIDGDVVGDDSLFPWQRSERAWSADDAVWGYGAPVSALTIADNQLRLTITPIRIPPQGHGGPINATVQLEQHGVAYYTVKAEVETVRAGEPSGIDVIRLAGSRELRVVGSIAEGARPDVEEISIDDPALYAAMALRQILDAHGISVGGVARANHDEINVGGPGFLTQLRAPLGPENAAIEHKDGCCSCLQRPQSPTLASHRSLPLGDDVLFTNKMSQNLHAELLLHALGAVPYCTTGTTVEGARMVRAFALRAGIAGDKFILFDGSGLSAQDLVAPEALTQLLVYAAKQPWSGAFEASLPVGGVDGTLAGRFLPPGSALRGKVKAKTGTLGESRDLAGYVTAVSGKTLVFSVMVDNHPPTGGADRVAMDKIVEAIATGN